MTKFALSEDNPTIKPYPEHIWAEMEDARMAPVSLSLDLLDAVHGRLVLLLRSLDSAAFDRTMFHPERGAMSLNDYLALYQRGRRRGAAHVEIGAQLDAPGPAGGGHHRGFERLDARLEEHAVDSIRRSAPAARSATSPRVRAGP